MELVKMTVTTSEEATIEVGLPPADEIPVLEPAPPDKATLIRYLVSGARRILKPGKAESPESLSTAIHSATRRLAAARFLLKNPATGHPQYLPSAPDWLHRAKPENQAAFHEWVQATFMRVFRLEKQTDGPMIPIDAPVVKGLTVYAVRNGTIMFYGAWTELDGNFIGWMRIQPQVAGIESDYAVGEILGMSVFAAISIDLSGHDALDRFTRELKETAWDLGLAEG